LTGSWRHLRRIRTKAAARSAERRLAPQQVRALNISKNGGFCTPLKRFAALFRASAPSRFTLSRIVYHHAACFARRRDIVGRYQIEHCARSAPHIGIGIHRTLDLVLKRKSLDCFLNNISSGRA